MRSKSAYEDALEKASDFENLSPKEKALHLIDEIISKISVTGKSKAEQLGYIVTYSILFLNSLKKLAMSI